ncbi:MAG: hypothetical protein AAF289_18165, partial [Cyanobacteria bacterium P01_A01_bin.135]
MKFSILSQSRRKVAGFAALLILPVAVACSGDAPETASAPPAEAPTSSEPVAAAPESTSGTIVDVAIANGSFDTLVA